MPTTIVTKTAEFEAATTDEVAALVAEFEAAHAANVAAEAEADEKFGAHPEYRSEAYTARREWLDAQGTAQRLVRAQSALKACRSLPVGTVVRFSTSAGWEGTDSDEGTIAEVTDSSYVVRKVFGGKARLDRENAHEYKPSYSGGLKGARSLTVLRTPGMERAARAERVAKQQERDREQALVRAQQERVRARRDALAAQHGLIFDARSKAVQVLLARHAAEYDALVTSTLDLLALDAPGRKETAPLEG